LIRTAMVWWARVSLTRSRGDGAISGFDGGGGERLDVNEVMNAMFM